MPSGSGIAGTGIETEGIAFNDCTIIGVYLKTARIARFRATEMIR